MNKNGGRQEDKTINENNTGSADGNDTKTLTDNTGSVNGNNNETTNKNETGTEQDASSQDAPAKEPPKECAHDYSVFTGWLQEPTCYCEGVANLKCSKCGSLGAFSGYAGSGRIDHIFLKTGVIIQEATCISPASYETACSMCGLKSIEYSGDKGEHIWRRETGVDLFGDSYDIRICTVCGIETE